MTLIDARQTDKAREKQPSRLSRVLAGSAPSWRYWVLLSSITIVGAIVRTVAARDEFWLDEIWSILSFAAKARTPLDVFRFPHDNNHHLVTLWMYMVGPQSQWIIYRLPSLTAGIATIGLASWFAKRFGTLASAAAALFTAASFLLITYASEARGYALAGCCALVAFLALDRWLATRSWMANLLFLGSTVAGTLSHLTYAQFYVAATVYSVLACTRRAETWRSATLRLLSLHALPIAFLAMVYVQLVRPIEIGGGDPAWLPGIVKQTLALVPGVFNAGQTITPAAATLVLIGIVAGLWLLWREQADLAVFFAIAIFVAPALVLAWQTPEALFPRYFYLPFLFVLLLFSFLLARLFESEHEGRVCALVALLVYLGGNLYSTGKFLAIGRGHYLDTISQIAAQSGDDIVMSVDGMRDNFYAQFYVPYLPPQLHWHLQSLDEHTFGISPWVVVNHPAIPFDPPPRIVIRKQSYLLESVAPYYGLSGLNFAVYRLASNEPP
jgi:hypothetical protein